MDPYRLLANELLIRALKDYAKSETFHLEVRGWVSTAAPSFVLAVKLLAKATVEQVQGAMIEKMQALDAGQPL